MLDQESVARIFSGEFSFLRPSPEELRRIVPNFEKVLPVPWRIFLEPEEATPLLGFPVLVSPKIRELDHILGIYLEAETKLQLELLTGETRESDDYESAWVRYQQGLGVASENAIRSSFGRRYASIFWLYHSLSVARFFDGIPQRALEMQPDLGSEADRLKYLVFDRFLDGVLAVTYDSVERAAAESEDEETQLFPSLLERMRDNVLILTEVSVGSDLARLDSFLRGYLRIDAEVFREKLERLSVWHARTLSEDPLLGSAVRDLIDLQSPGGPWHLLSVPGYVAYLSRHVAYDSGELLSPEQVSIWEGLLPKLKEFELMDSLRDRVMAVEETTERLTCKTFNFGGGHKIARTVTLSHSTRPLDFMTPWVVDPLVERCGLVYDITDFSAIVSKLRREPSNEQDLSYRRIFRFQRWINQLARIHRLTLEKYLGDGALYSGRHPDRLLAVGIRLQRRYRSAVAEGFPFDRGIRIALNFGQYRLLPVEEGDLGEGLRYEFFGHGIIELSRLVTGKTRQQIDDVMSFLLTVGYPKEDLDRFFGPALSQRLDAEVSVLSEGGGFRCQINRFGTLINQGIVATQEFIEKFDDLDLIGDLSIVRDGDRRYLAFSFDDRGEEILVGLRILGRASLKGLGRVAVYEIVDGSEWDNPEMEPVGRGRLLDRLEMEPPASPEQLDLL